MNELVNALRNKISVLEDEIEEYEDFLARSRSRLEVYQDLLSEETGEEPSQPKKKSGRPKGSKNKSAKTPARKSKKAQAPKDELWEEAQSSLPGGSQPSSEEEQKRARARFKPTPRVGGGYGGVRVGGKVEEVLDAAYSKRPTSHASISVEDGEENK